MIERLKRENPDSWRLVIFTSRRETQTTIQLFLEGHGLTVGLINGQSGSRNQDTIGRFRSDPPQCRVIVSTEAGSEGVNLQVANVLVNYDLPWNPMIVEQRIGRVQRLASRHASVGIFNITLRGTFEEYIVGRLMEKLQMSASAIGDIEALLEGSGVGGEDGEDFEEKVRELVVAALRGFDMEASTRMMVESIREAKANLEREEKRIDEMLGGGDGQSYVGPRAPSLPAQERSLGPKDFTLCAFDTLGAVVSERGPDLFMVDDEAGRDLIRFENEGGKTSSTLYAAGSSAFSRLVQRVVTSGVHQVEDRDDDPRPRSEALARSWTARFGGEVESVEIEGARQRFEGTALVRARAIVAHDSYERLIEVPCSAAEVQDATFSRIGLAPVPNLVEQPSALGIDPEKVIEAAYLDPGLAEFSRFYLERRAHEMEAAGRNERKRKKMADDFTPRFTFTLAGADGALHRETRAKLRYCIDGGELLTSEITIIPSSGAITSEPKIQSCAVTKKSVPEAALGQCCVTGLSALRHLLSKSEHSGRIALPEHMLVCEQSGRRLIRDEADRSDVSGRMVGTHLLRTCTATGRRAEAEHFGRCAFTSAEVLKSELVASDLSGKLFRSDQSLQSSVSGKIGHRNEFILCAQTRHPVATSEAEICDSTGSKVRPGILETCQETGTRVLPSELSRSAVSGRRVLKKLLWSWS